MPSLFTFVIFLTLFLSLTNAFGFGYQGGRQNCQCRSALSSSIGYTATMNCCFGRDLGAVPDATTGCDLVDFPFSSPAAGQQICRRDLGGVSTILGPVVAGDSNPGFPSMQHHPMSEAFGTASLSSGGVLRGPQCSSEVLDGEDEELVGGGCIHEKRFVACCANQGAAGGYCWDS